MSSWIRVAVWRTSIAVAAPSRSSQRLERRIDEIRRGALGHAGEQAFDLVDGLESAIGQRGMELASLRGLA
jgi:hypothetical protein